MVSTQTERTIAIAFQSGSDVTSRQIIYKQGRRARGMNLTMDAGNLYFTAHHNNTWPAPVSISTSLSTNTLYWVIMEFDATNDEMRGKVNGTILTPNSGIASFNGNGNSTALGANYRGVRFHDNSNSNTNYTNFLQGNTRIYELMIFNGNLSTNDYTSLETYLNGKYGP